MGQWGQVGKYDGITFLPHVNTGENPFNPIRPGSFIDSIVVLDRKSEDLIHEEYAMKKKFVGMPYSEYLELVDRVCPCCKQEVKKRQGG